MSYGPLNQNKIGSQAIIDPVLCKLLTDRQTNVGLKTERHPLRLWVFHPQAYDQGSVQ